MKFNIKNKETIQKDTFILIVKVTYSHEQFQQRIYHLETLTTSLRINSPAHMRGKTLHTFIVIDNSLITQDISFVETISLSILFLDICITGELTKNGVSLTHDEMIRHSRISFHPPISTLTKWHVFREDDRRSHRTIPHQSVPPILIRQG